MPENIGQNALARIVPAAADKMRSEIKDAGGREVFFAGSLSAQGLVEKVRVCARGNEDSVPALLENLAPREVIIHNHPTGDIGPSEPDLDIASICGHNGHGMFIVDNAVTRVYVVIEPFLDREIVKLDPAEMGEIFAPKGPLARLVKPFERRPQQHQMMEAVARAFNHDGIAVIEAPTGVGKTFAYLIPAVLWAVHNHERVVVSTRTINLQEQIVLKDIPVLAKCLKEPFNAVLVKGRSNYLCKRKLDRAISEMTLFEDGEGEASLKAIAEWAENTQDGSRSDLSFVPHRELWEKVCSEADTCSGSRCAQFRDCFVTKARREIAKADLIVANHHILFSDVAVKKDLGDFSSVAVLPAYRRLVLDEAHSVEDSATEYFGIQATRGGAMVLLSRFIRRERSHERGLLPFLKLRLVKDAPRLEREEYERILTFVDEALIPSIEAVREALTVAFDCVRSLTTEKCGQIGRDIKWRLTEKELNDPDLREVHEVYVLPAAEEIVACANHCGELCMMLKRLKPDPATGESPMTAERMELQAYHGRLLRLAAALREITSEEAQPNTVRWIEIDAASPAIVRLLRCPLDVGACLSEWVYDNIKTIVMTSATLTVQKRFDYLFSRIGLDRTDSDRIEKTILDTPFQFEDQALLCVLEDMPPPDDRSFHDETVQCIERILRITKGHALVLFTSFFALDNAHKRLEPTLREMGIAALKQGGAARTNILNRFRDDVSSVLFGTDSFWEGVDVAGDALQCVILPKLPFRVPTEPIQQARAEAIDASGGNSFLDYTVPQAVIKFRQGFGRLIRRRTDRGTIIVLDRRIRTKYYGRAFLESLPGTPVVCGAQKDVLEALEAFYRRKDDANGQG